MVQLNIINMFPCQLTSLLASVILEGGNICTHKTISLAIWILLISYARHISTQLTFKKTLEFDLIPFSYIKSVEINDITAS